MSEAVHEKLNLSRLPDWELRLTEYIMDSRNAGAGLQMDWEATTCTSWVGGAIEAVTGVDPYQPWKGRHKDAFEAIRRIREGGFNSLEELIASLFVEIPPVMAQRGDIGFILARWNADRPQGWEFEEDDPADPFAKGLVVVDGPFVWGLTEGGLGRANSSDLVRAFAVGAR